MSQQQCSTAEQKEIIHILLPRALTPADCYFFISAGALLALMIELSSIFFPQWNNEIFITLVNDQMPLATVMLLFCLLTTLILLAITLPAPGPRLSLLIQLLTLRIHQLLIPLLLMLLGIIIILLVLGLMTANAQYFGYVVQFGCTFLIPYLYIVITNMGSWAVKHHIFVNASRYLSAHPWRRIAIQLTIVSCIFPALLYFTHSSSASIGITLNADEYARLRALAQSQQITPEEWLKKQAQQSLQASASGNSL